MGQKSQPGTSSRESSPKQFRQQQRQGSVWTTWEGERAQFSMGRKTGRQGSVKLALGLFPFCRHLTESFFRGGTLERRQRAKRFRWGSGSFQKASAWAPSDRSEAQLGTRLYGAWWNSGHWRARRWILATGSFWKRAWAQKGIPKKCNLAREQCGLMCCFFPTMWNKGRIQI